MSLDSVGASRDAPLHRPFDRRLARLLAVALTVGGAFCQGCATPAVSPPASAQVATPPLGIIPPNASRITATVVRQMTWPPGTLDNVRPPVRPNQTLYSLTITIETAEPEGSDVSSIAPVGTTIEAFSSAPFPADVTGKRIEATLKLMGDTQGSRWWISDLRPAAFPTDLQRRLARKQRKEAQLPSPFDQPAEAQEFFALKRVPDGATAIPVERYLEAREHARLMPQHSARESHLRPFAAALDAAFAPATSTVGTWTSLGPGNIGGRTRALVINPTNPTIMYAGGVAGGVWKTTNGGASWTPLTDPLTLTRI